VIELGDIVEDATITFLWATNDQSGASITRATDGQIRVYKEDDVIQSVAGIVDTEDFDSMTGVHCCKIDTSADSFYETGKDYNVVLSGAGIDGQTVNAPIAHFSIQNRTSLLQAPATEGGTWTIEKLLKVLAAWASGKWQTKAGESNVYQILDPDDGVTVIMEVTVNADSPQRQISVQV
jgi:hypothetical protein